MGCGACDSLTTLASLQPGPWWDSVKDFSSSLRKAYSYRPRGPGRELSNHGGSNYQRIVRAGSRANQLASNSIICSTVSTKIDYLIKSYVHWQFLVEMFIILILTVIVKCI